MNKTYNDNGVTNEGFEKLKEPLNPKYVKFMEKSGTWFSYITNQIVEGVLDKYCGHHWENKVEIGQNGEITNTITIYHENGRKISRSDGSGYDVGYIQAKGKMLKLNKYGKEDLSKTEDAENSIKTAITDSFKRAGVKFGINRLSYSVKGCTSLEAVKTLYETAYIAYINAKANIEKGNESIEKKKELIEEAQENAGFVMITEQQIDYLANAYSQNGDNGIKEAVKNDAEIQKSLTEMTREKKAEVFKLIQEANNKKKEENKQSDLIGFKEV